MHTIKFLNHAGHWTTPEARLEYLSTEYGIKVSNNPKYPDLFVLNYSQIDSPKFHPIVKECRSLVVGVEDNKFSCVSRAFDRFYNYSEEIEYEPDITNMVAYEKVDGSLVSVFSYKGEWLYRTKSMIMPEADLMINGSSLSWKELIEGTLNFPSCCNFLDRTSTYIMEVVSPENRVVTRYDNREIYLLSIRNNKSGDYVIRK